MMSKIHLLLLLALCLGYSCTLYAVQNDELHDGKADIGNKGHINASHAPQLPLPNTSSIPPTSPSGETDPKKTKKGCTKQTREWAVLLAFLTSL